MRIIRAGLGTHCAPIVWIYVVCLWIDDNRVFEIENAVESRLGKIEGAVSRKRLKYCAGCHSRDFLQGIAGIDLYSPMSAKFTVCGIAGVLDCGSVSRSYVRLLVMEIAGIWVQVCNPEVRLCSFESLCANARS